MGRFIVLIIIYGFWSNSIFAKNIEVGKKHTLQSIKEAISIAQNGDTVLIEKGIYKEHDIVIDKSIYLKGIDHPIIDAEGKSQIITITTSWVTIDGLVLKNGKFSSSIDYSMIKAIGVDHITIINNTIEKGCFGISFANTKYVVIENNEIRSNAIKESSSGNGIHCLKSDSILVKNNRIIQHRDGIYFEFVNHAVTTNNICEKNIRYGLHFMFSHDNSFLKNQFINNGTGVAVMYSNRVTMIENEFIHNWGFSAYGVLLKDMNDCMIANNKFEKNTVAIVMEGCNRNLIAQNNITNNGWALKISANCMDNKIVQNNFVGNTFDVVTNGSKTLDRYDNNYWDKYQGYDLNKDGYGDAPYRPCSVFANITEQYPVSMILFRSMMVYLLDKVEKVIPDIIPENLIDTKPKMTAYAIH